MIDGLGNTFLPPTPAASQANPIRPAEPETQEWFSASPMAAADSRTIVATPEFDPGTSTSDMSRQIRSHIGE
jgi:hypothetical protein